MEEPPHERHPDVTQLRAGVGGGGVEIKMWKFFLKLQLELMEIPRII